MLNRNHLALVGSVLVAGSLACSGSVNDPSAVTSLPTSDSVANDATQFCSDATNYILNNVASLLSSDCAYSGSAASGTSECEMQYNACVSASQEVSTSTVVASESQELRSACQSTVTDCTGVTVGQAAQCIADDVSALQAAASQITATSVCSGKTPPSPGTPASCSALPSTCKLGGSSSVSVSSGGG
jgi:hypothetical protein